MKGFTKWIRQTLCRHEWKRSMFVNIQTGENLGCLCVKCRKWKP